MLKRKTRPTQIEAEAAIRTLLDFLGDDAEREGLVDTPARVVRAYAKNFAGYAQDPEDHLVNTFDDVNGYDEAIVLRDIDFVSTCEHHLVPIVGKVHIAYMPDRRVIGLSKLVDVVDTLTRRLQVQERLTEEIADAIENGLKARGVAVLIEAKHFCMGNCGTGSNPTTTTTKAMRGSFHHQPERSEVMALLKGK